MSQPRPGAQALSSDLTNLFELAGTGILDGITEVINRYAITPLMQLKLRSVSGKRHPLECWDLKLRFLLSI